MIKVVAKNVLKEGSKEKVLEMLDELIEKTRKEDGCYIYELYESLDDPNTVTFIEEWESMEKLQAHIDSEHFKRIVPAVGEFNVGKEAIDIYKKLR